MPNQALVPDPDRLEVLSLRVEAGTIILTTRTCGETTPCPLCGQPSSRVHSRYSRYRRTLADLPWQAIPARLILWSRRFFCDTAACPRRIFTERLPGVAAPHARRTNRLRDWLGHIAFALGGEPGARPAPPARDSGLWRYVARAGARPGTSGPAHAGAGSEHR
jgi:transposase